MFKNAMKYGGIILGKLEDEIKRRRTFAILCYTNKVCLNKLIEIVKNEI
jgi:hypothetical protein